MNQNVFRILHKDDTHTREVYKMTRTLEKCTAIRHGSSATKDRRWCGFLREGLGLRFVHACSACKLCNLLTTLLMTYLFSFVDLLLLVIIRWFLLPLLPTLKLITSKRL